MGEHNHDFEIINGAGTYCYARCIVEGCRTERTKQEIASTLNDHAALERELAILRRWIRGFGFSDEAIDQYVSLAALKEAEDG